MGKPGVQNGLVNLFTGAAILTSVVGGSKVADVLSGKERGTVLERHAAANAVKGVAMLQLTVNKKSYLASAVLVEDQYMITAAHTFEVISGSKSEVEGKVKKFGAMPKSFAKVFFSQNPESENFSNPGLRIDIEDVVICSNYNLRDISDKNKRHDIAIIKLKKPAPAPYVPYRKFSSSKQGPVAVTDRGATSLDNDPGGVLSVSQFESRTVKRNDGDFFVIDVNKKHTPYYGSSGGACENDEGLIGVVVGPDSGSDFVDGLYSNVIVAKIEDNLDCLKAGFQQLAGHGQPVPF